MVNTAVFAPLLFNNSLNNDEFNRNAIYSGNTTPLTKAT